MGHMGASASHLCFRRNNLCFTSGTLGALDCSTHHDSCFLACCDGRFLGVWSLQHMEFTCCCPCVKNREDRGAGQKVERNSTQHSFQYCLLSCQLCMDFPYVHA